MWSPSLETIDEMQALEGHGGNRAIPITSPSDEGCESEAILSEHGSGHHVQLGELQSFGGAV
jgi:hypothetical protein